MLPTPINEEFSSPFFFVYYKTPTSLRKANEKDSLPAGRQAPPWVALNHEATGSNYQFEHEMYLQSLMTVHVRWPARPAVRSRRMIFLPACR